jgi:hypothetical protein
LLQFYQGDYDRYLISLWVVWCCLYIFVCISGFSAGCVSQKVWVTHVFQKTLTVDLFPIVWKSHRPLKDLHNGFQTHPEDGNVKFVEALENI